MGQTNDHIMMNPYDILFQKMDRMQTMLNEIIEHQKHEGSAEKAVDRSLIATRKVAAEYLGLSVSTIDNLVKSKQLKATKIGSSTRFRWQDLDAFVEKRAR